MAPRSKVTQLPDPIREELEQKLINSSFSGYESLSEWLIEQGFEISKSSLHRWGSNFEDRCQALQLATQQAKAIVQSSPDDTGDMSEALMRLMQERLFSALVDIEVDPAKLNLSSLAKAIAPIARASIAQKKFTTEVRERAKAVASTLDSLTKSSGLSAETADMLRKQILGIAA